MQSFIEPSLLTASVYTAATVSDHHSEGELSQKLQGERLNQRGACMCRDVPQLQVGDHWVRPRRRVADAWDPNDLWLI